MVHDNIILDKSCFDLPLDMASRTHYSGRMGQRKGRVSKMDRKQMYFKKKNRQQVDDEINTLTEECTKVFLTRASTFTRINGNVSYICDKRLQNVHIV